MITIDLITEVTISEAVEIMKTHSMLKAYLRTRETETTTHKTLTTIETNKTDRMTDIECVIINFN